ncbi:mitochondrial distribution and morphology protein 10 [Lineolata rhizophorae]|uniref:Mitochondrial distribution and morphology protein 10 n=1 Tax=Lineolata rhizophorae TaxID=578093 RepID=A0A6A6NNB5_9PEZI|nr:mitochondrial distribution and morphology protein 10 [Lineolata rhizophorae]
MLDFMDYVQHAFYKSSRWNQDNSYSSLTATVQSLLDFETPRGLRLKLSSLPSPNFASSYTIGSVGLVDGSVSYLYSSLPLNVNSRSPELDLHDVVQGYRHLQDLRKPDDPRWWELWHRGRRIDRRAALLYGRFYLPRSSLEALYLRRISPTRQLKISCVSDNYIPNGGTLLAVLQEDQGKYSTEYLYSTDSCLLGWRGLYNFGPDPRDPAVKPESLGAAVSEATLPSSELYASNNNYGRFSAGAELYYGLLNKSGGMSTGIRFTTLPRHRSFPYTMTLTLNPLMGNLSSTYAVKAGPNLAMCSRFDFNFYSYESGFQLGCELWRRQGNRGGGGGGSNGEGGAEVEWAAKKMTPEWTGNAKRPDDDVSGVLKARVNERWDFGVLWEGRFKELLFTLGASFDLKRREQIFRAVGLELQYSS